MNKIDRSDYRRNHHQRRPAAEDKAESVSSTQKAALKALPNTLGEAKYDLHRAAMRAKGSESLQIQIPASPPMASSPESSEEIDPASIPSKKERNRARSEKSEVRARHIDRERSEKYRQSDESLPLEKVFSESDPKPALKGEKKKAFNAPIPVTVFYPSDVDSEDSDHEGTFDSVDALALSYLKRKDY